MRKNGARILNLVVAALHPVPRKREVEGDESLKLEPNVDALLLRWAFAQVRAFSSNRFDGLVSAQICGDRASAISLLI